MKLMSPFFRWFFNKIIQRGLYSWAEHTVSIKEKNKNSGILLTCDVGSDVSICFSKYEHSYKAFALLNVPMVHGAR